MKYALLVGINYRSTKAELKGCINDVKHIHTYLVEDRGYLPENIVVLTEDTHKKPTGMNIMHALGTLILKAHTKNAEELWFHYSGHGSYTADKDGDEDDGRDETIVPLDYKQNGMITDDQLHDYISNIPRNCKLFCIFDCCHSGTMLDLKWRYEGQSRNVCENSDSKINSKIMMFSGCADIQTSADAHIKGKWAGAMTTAFLECIGRSVTCYELLDNMRDYMQENHYSQKPRLTCSYKLSDSDIFPKN